ncbi:MAG: alpha/beta hydrolase [Ignavibacteria bacterium]|nr:alpha/beta hydrolase [Ignavibacteria bacterium]
MERKSLLRSNLSPVNSRTRVETQITQFEFEIVSDNNKKIIGDIRFCPNFLDEALPIVIFVHGFTGHKNWGFLPYFAERIALQKMISIVFNFSTDEVDPQTEWFTNVEKFASFTISGALEELNFLITKTVTKEIFPVDLYSFVDSKRLFLIGQSLGGGISSIYTAKYPKITKLVLIGAVGTFFRYTKRQIAEWETKGALTFENSRTGQELKLNFSYYKDLIDNGYYIERFLQNISIPTLFVHGSEDLTVPLKEIQKAIALAINPLIELNIIANAGHTFGIEHPFRTSSESLELVISLTIEFLTR